MSSTEISSYDYPLLDKNIAIRPPAVRGSTRLLIMDRSSGKIEDSYYKNLDQYLNKGDLVILNNTKVIKARLRAQTDQGKERELLILEKHGKDKNSNQFYVMFRGKIHPGQLLSVNGEKIEVIEVYENGTALVRAKSNVNLLADNFGSVPLPPYLNRDADDTDVERYQTVFAKYSGSVAAPTASLNFTDELLNKLKNKGVNIFELTLHVGLGTFLPIREKDFSKHKMHEEYFEISTQTIEAIQKAKHDGRKVIAVGTTVTRAMEYSASTILSAPPNQKINGEANIFIYPGYDFQVVDGMLTNFHAPKSTVLMMAAAFAGWNNLKNAYLHAIDENYKFLSYGDSMLII